MNVSAHGNLISTRRPRLRQRLLVVATLVLASLPIAANTANAVVPGSNGLIAYTSDQDSGFNELFLFDPANGTSTKIPTTDGVIENPAWSPDGASIAYSGGGTISVVDVASGDRTMVNEDAAYQPAWSPDGTSIAFTRYDQGRAGIWLMNADGSDVIRLTSGDDLDPAWSPDGGSIAFTRRMILPTTGHVVGTSVYVMNPDGSAQVRVMHGELDLSHSEASWSPDGGRLAVVKSFGISAIAVVQRDDADVAEEITQYTSAFNPSWSPDGSVVAYAGSDDGDFELYTVPSTGLLNPTKLTDNSAWDSMPDWQPLAAVGSATPTCSIASTQVTERTANAGQASFEITCDNPTTDTFSLSYASGPGTARDIDDFVPVSGTVPVPPGPSNAQVLVDVVGDIDPEPHEAFSVTINSTDVAITDDTATATIVDDDGLTVTVETRSVVEGNGAMVDVPVAVRLSDAADQPIEVLVVGANGAGLRSTRTITFAPGDTEEEFTYPVDGDLDDELDELVEFAPIAWTINDASSVNGALTILDDDETDVSIDDVLVTEGNTGPTTALFTVSRSQAGRPAAVDFATVAGSATAGEDFVSHQGTASFGTGVLTATVAVDVTGDLLDELNETFEVHLANPVDATITDGSGVATIVDDDGQPTLSVDDVSILEGNSGAKTARFTVSLSASSSLAVSFDIAAFDDTATSPDDFAGAPTSLTILPPALTAQFDVSVNGDLLAEDDETFTVELSNPTNATTLDASGVGTIVDDDGKPTVSIDPVSVVTEGDSGTTGAFFSVRLSSPSDQTVTVDYTTSDGTAHSPDDYGAEAEQLVFDPGTLLRVIEVQVRGDILPEPDEYFSVDLIATQNAVIDQAHALGTIVSDEGHASNSFAGALPIGTSGISFDTSLMSSEAGEPGLPSPIFASKSVWFRLSPGRGGVELHADLQPGSILGGQSFPRGVQISVYRGNNLAQLTLISRRASSNFPNTADVGETIDLAFFSEDNFPVNTPYYVQILSASGPGDAAMAGSGVTLTQTFHPAPDNDDFANATVLSGAGTTVAVDTSMARVEAGEFVPPTHSSVWFRVFPAAGYQFRVVGGPMSTGGFQVSVFTGSSLSSLTLVKQASTPGFTASAPGESVTLAVPPAPQGYYIQVVGRRACGFCQQFPPIDNSPFVFEPEWGNATITTERFASPPNDRFDNPLELLVGSEVDFDTSFATVEPGEPAVGVFGIVHVPSVWFTLNSGPTTALTLSATGSDLGAGLHSPVEVTVYTGSSLTQLTLVARAESPPSKVGGAELAMRVQPGTTYRVRVRGLAVCAGCAGFNSSFGLDLEAQLAGIGVGTIEASLYSSPANDHFANAVPLTPNTTADTSFATTEPDEPGVSPPPPSSSSIWYRTVGGLGDLTLTSFGPDARRLDVYTGSTIDALTRVGTGSSTGFPGAPPPGFFASATLTVATGCQPYSVQVTGRSAFVPGSTLWNRSDVGVGTGSLTTDFQAAPLTNDDFTGAAVLPIGHTELHDLWWTCASAQTGEPAHAASPAARSVWFRFTPPDSGRVTITSPGSRVAVYQGAALASLTAIRGAASGPVTFDTRGGTFFIAVDGGTGTGVDVTFVPGEVKAASTRILTTDDEVPGGNGATAADPIETAITQPVGATGTVSIFESDGQTPASAWTFLNWKVDIVAAPVTAADPYLIVFTVDATLVAPTAPPLQVFRNGVQVPNCPPGVTIASPDPCVASRFGGGSNDRQISVRTSRASVWTLGVSRSTSGVTAGSLVTATGGNADFLVGSIGTNVAGFFTYTKAGQRFIALSVDSLAIDGTVAWIAGVGIDRRPFLLYVEDRPGSNDRFRLWINGVEQTGTDGLLRTGVLSVRAG